MQLDGAAWSHHPAFVILVSAGGSYWDTGVLPRDPEAPKGTQEHSLFTLLMCKLFKRGGEYETQLMEIKYPTKPKWFDFAIFFLTEGDKFQK